MHTNKKTTFQLAAIEGREYDLNTGWYFADYEYKLQECKSEADAIAGIDAFVASLNITEDDVYQICLYKETWILDKDGVEDGPQEPTFDCETLDVIDGSESLSDYKYQVNQYFDQYMIPSIKPLSIDYVNTACSTVNQLMKRFENSSFQWHPIGVYKTVEEVIDMLDGRRFTTHFDKFKAKANEN